MKKFLSALLATMMVVSLVACGQKQTASTANNAAGITNGSQSAGNAAGTNTGRTNNATTGTTGRR